MCVIKQKLNVFALGFIVVNFLANVMKLAGLPD